VAVQVFEINPLEYIRRDAEGSDSDTRRRAAADLVKSLTVKYPAQVTQLCTGYVQVSLPSKDRIRVSRSVCTAD
jgi:exportin-2 (importin alpha re-exporter)